MQTFNVLLARALSWRYLAVASAVIAAASMAAVPPGAQAQSSGARFTGQNHRGIEINLSKQYAQGGVGTNGMAVYDDGYVDYRPYVGDGHGHIIGAGFFKGYYNYSNCLLATISPT
jgi:hypothetical protein